MRFFVSTSNQKNIFFGNYQKFDETKFLSDLKITSFSSTFADPYENYLYPMNSLSKIVEKHVPLKKKNLEKKSCIFCFLGTKESYIY